MNDAAPPTEPMNQHERKMRRVCWIAGSRGEILLLGSVLQGFDRRPDRPARHWFFSTGESGMAGYQALDWLELIPEEAGPICHPADEPAVRLNIMIERVEAFVRQRKGTHIVFAGVSPAAAAAAIYAHARGCPALWLRLPDPAGVIPRLRWEAGLERIIHACAPCVSELRAPALPDWLAWKRKQGGEGNGERGESGESGTGEGNGAAKTVDLAEPLADLANEIPGLRPGAPLMLIAVLRRDWGYLDDATSRLARAAAEWAKGRPDADFCFVSNLNARLEGPLRSLHDRPANLLQTAPLPYPIWRALLAQARLLLTDSPLIAGEGLREGVPVAVLGDVAANEGVASTVCRHLLPSDLMAEHFIEFLKATLNHEATKCVLPTPEATGITGPLAHDIQDWLDGRPQS